MITARDELQHLIESLTEAEAERALELLAPLARGGADGPAPRFPVWRPDGRAVDVSLPAD